MNDDVLGMITKINKKKKYKKYTRNIENRK